MRGLNLIEWNRLLLASVEVHQSPAVLASHHLPQHLIPLLRPWLLALCRLHQAAQNLVELQQRELGGGLSAEDGSVKHIPVALQIHVSPPYLAIHLEQDVGFDAGFKRNDGAGTFEACEDLKILVRVERDTGAELPLGAGALFGERLFRII